MLEEAMSVHGAALAAQLAKAKTFPSARGKHLHCHCHCPCHTTSLLHPTQACALSGCDYANNIRGVGVVTVSRLMPQFLEEARAEGGDYYTHGNKAVTKVRHVCAFVVTQKPPEQWRMLLLLLLLLLPPP